MRTWGMRAVRVALLILPLTLAACQTLMKPSACGPDGCAPDGAPVVVDPKVCHTPTMHALACDLDHLERHIDWYGSVVAKVPDVWGQARLTQHREEFERVMVKDLETFEVNLQGALARSDQSFFQQSVALSAAVSGGVATTRVPPGVSSTAATAPQNTAQQVLVSPIALSDTNFPALVTSTGTASNSEFFKTFTPAGPNFVGFTPGQGGAPGTLNIGLEPTLKLAQKKQYLDFLNQLRRENEGDDTGDSPGYGIGLVRIPVSILPGKRTDQGHGAEVTFTIAPVLGDDLLPTTFRNLVANDLRQQLGFPLTQVLGDRTVQDEFLNGKIKVLIEGADLIRTWSNHLVVSNVNAEQNVKAAFTNPNLSEQDKDRIKAAVVSCIEPSTWPANPTDQDYVSALVLIIQSFQRQNALVGKKMGCDSPLPPDAKSAAPIPPAVNGQPPAPGGGNGQQKKPQLKPAVNAYGGLRAGLGWKEDGGKTPQAAAAMIAATQKLTPPVVSFSNGLNNRLAFPPSQIYDVIGDAFAFQIAYGASQALRASIERQGYAHLPDVQSYLQEEVRAAQQFLAQPANQHLWTKFCTPDLVTAIRSRQVARLQNLREEFRCEVERLTESDQYRLSRPDNELLAYSTTAALAWCVIVDSALLTDRLVQDMKTVATSKGQRACPEAWLPYYLPEPPPEARQAFNAYVKLRWPIHVFALDPATQDQNLADSLLTRRETQLALSMAFTSGKINARTLTRYARRLEGEYDTIALNRTQVGFAHGENTFGWRFYPRFQTPDTESNLTTLVRDQLVGGPNRNALLRQRRLEPGPRECVAIVMMPSFVPYVSIDSTSNWFGLANPKHKVLDHTQALKMSRTVQTLKTGGPNVGDACDYRDGEFERLLRRAEQLEARLPTQTQTVPVPVMNTLGGFEMFSNGTTDLAPELYGWYGAPGVDAKKATTLFLVGDHFSPLRTRVIVGNKEVPEDKRKMLSRQVMQVEVSADQVVLVDRKDGKPYAQAHVATPYGVTRELIIPIVVSDAVTPDGYYLRNEFRTLSMTYVKTPGKDTPTVTVSLGDVGPAPITFRGVFGAGALPKLARVEFSFDTAPAIAFDAALEADANGNYVIPTATLADKVAKPLVASVFTAPLPNNVDPATKMPRKATLRVTPTDTTTLKGVPTSVIGEIGIIFTPK